MGEVPSSQAGSPEGILLPFFLENLNWPRWRSWGALSHSHQACPETSRDN